MNQQLKANLQKRRNTKSIRVGVIIVLILILLAMYFIGGKMKGLLLVLLVIAFSALGLQVTDYDLDLATLWETGSLTESRVEQRKGYKILGSECVSDNLNCADFTTQQQAQAMYEKCAQKIASDNQGTDANEIKSVDIYGLDGDKDGKVCEHLSNAR